MNKLSCFLSRQLYLSRDIIRLAIRLMRNRIEVILPPTPSQAAHR